MLSFSQTRPAAAFSDSAGRILSHAHIVERIGGLTVYTNLKMAMITIGITGTSDIPDSLPLGYLVSHAYAAF